MIFIYSIKPVKAVADIASAAIAPIDKYCWGGDYRPKAWAQLCRVMDKGFAVKLFCEEKNPLAQNTQMNSPVHEDSCLEFFVNFYPAENAAYFNFEANSNGVHHCEFGEKRGTRKNLSDLSFPLPSVTPFKEENGWGLLIEIPYELIKAGYGKAEFNSGDEICGNFYKCGDKTASPHYGSYGEIKAEHPDFHTPDCFVKMRIE